MNRLTEEQILDYLMTSEFDEGLTPEEYKFLLQKFRNFYRVVSCSITLYQDRMQSAINESEKIKSDYEIKVMEFNNEKSELINKLDKILNKKLTFKERLLGKIIE